MNSSAMLVVEDPVGGIVQVVELTRTCCEHEQEREHPTERDREGRRNRITSIVPPSAPGLDPEAAPHGEE